MILTGKAKEDFLKWVKKRCNIKIHELIKVETWFDVQDDAFKNALIIEWFSTKRYGNYNLWNYCFSNAYWNRGMLEYMESIKQAIIKANEIYNERNII